MEKCTVRLLAVTVLGNVNVDNIQDDKNDDDNDDDDNDDDGDVDLPVTRWRRVL